MIGHKRALRYRSLLDRYAAALVVVVVLLGVAGGFLTYAAYGTTETTTETRQVGAWESSGEYTHSATVVNGTDIYDEGDVLRNRSTYFRQLTPRLNGTFDYIYTATGSGDVAVNATTVLVLQSVAEAEEGDPTVYWRLDAELAERSVSGLAPGEAVQVPFSVNVTDATQRLADIDEQFGSTPGRKELYVETRLALSGTRNGQPVDTTRTYRLPISVSDSVYSVQNAGPQTNSETQTERVEVTAAPGPLRAYGGPLALVVALALGITLVAAQTTDRFEISDREREWLAYRSARAEFDDWITTARVPGSKRQGTDIEVDSLEGLVDVAIDTDQRVLEDSNDGLFLVLDDARTYTYDPPTLSNGHGDVLAGDDGATAVREGGDATRDAHDGSEPAESDAEADSA